MDRAVEVTNTADGITLLFDTFSGESKNLLESFKNAGAAFHAAVIEDDGFLTDDDDERVWIFLRRLPGG